MEYTFTLKLLVLLLAAAVARVANLHDEIGYDPSHQMPDSFFANYGLKRDGMANNYNWQ